MYGDNDYNSYNENDQGTGRQDINQQGIDKQEGQNIRPDNAGAYDPNENSSGGIYSGSRGGSYSYGRYENYNVPPRQENQGGVYRNPGQYYNNPNISMQSNPADRDKKPVKGNVVLKVAVACLMGIAFGVFAAGGFYGVSRIMGLTGMDFTKQSSVIAPATESESLPATPAQSQAPVQPVINQSATTVVTDISEMVEAVMPSMVSITNNYTERAQFFGQTFESQGQSGGSGILVGENDEELLVVTNQHVISGANNLVVLFIDGNEVNAHVKGYDSAQDIAVIAVNKADVSKETMKSISFATLGDSSSLTLGEPTIAIGNAMGYGQSVTTGVVSALDREIGNNGKETYIQTDAAINPGNSGGALLNIKGEVIGINSNKLGGSIIEGIGYAIPISRVRPLIEDFMTRSTKGDKAAEGQRAYLGITGVDVTEDVSRTYNMPKGVYVAQIHTGAAAEKGGILQGDIITKFDGSSVTSMAELQDMLEYYTEGTQVDVEIQRGTPGGYQKKTVKVTLGNKRDMPQ